MICRCLFFFLSTWFLFIYCLLKWKLICTILLASDVQCSKSTILSISPRVWFILQWFSHPWDKSPFHLAGVSLGWHLQEARSFDDFTSPSYDVSFPISVCRVWMCRMEWAPVSLRVSSCTLLTGTTPAEETWNRVAGCPAGEYILQGHGDFTQYSNFWDHRQNHCSRGKGR